MFDVRRSRFFLFSVLLLLTMSPACGKKAMPSPPDAGPVPVATDLSHEIDGGDVRLKWAVPTELKEGEAIVSRARTKLDGGTCEGCPLVFQQVAVLPIHSLRSALTLTYRETLAPGFRYTYQVVLKTERGRTGAPSNLVTFDY